MKTLFRFTAPLIALVLLGLFAISAALASPRTAPLLRPAQTRTAEALATASALTPGTSALTPTAVSLPAVAPTQSLSAPTGIRKPLGIYAKVNVSEEIVRQQKANASITPEALNAYFNNLYQALLSNPAISGLELQVHWDQVNPNPPSAANPYDWSYVDDAFARASAWNSQNPTQPPKTIQLSVTPGFQSPQWILDQLPSCDGLFQSLVQTPPSNCGKVTFVGYGESTDGTVLPLPWNPVYKNAWQTFLAALAARYGSNPIFVSIAVAGPTAASEEMTTASNLTATNPQTEFGVSISPNDMWLKLLAFHYPNQPAYQNSDQAFIDEWNAAIDMYGQIFSGITLIVSTGAGLPDFSQKFTIASGFSPDCPRSIMECAAMTMILSHFAEPIVGGANAKASETGGLEASRASDPDMGVIAVRWLAQRTAMLPVPSAQILGGVQFNTSFSNDPAGEGCPTKGGCPNISPEQAEYNVLQVFFDGTPTAAAFGGTLGSAPLNYLQIYSTDIQYTTAHINNPVQIVQADDATVLLSAQDLLNVASQKLLQIAER